MRIAKLYVFFLGFICTAALSFGASTDITLDSTHLRAHVNNLTGISCDVAAQRCLGVGFISEGDSINHVVYRTQDGGYTWSKPIRLYSSIKTPMDKWSNRSMKVSCDDAGMLCHIAGSMRTHTKEYMFVSTTYNGGLTWNRQRFLRKQNSFSSVTGLACGTWGEHCVIVGKDEGISGNSFVYTTDDMGQVWSKSRTLPKFKNKTERNDTQDISCSDSGLVCTIVGGMEGYVQGAYVVKPISYVTTDGGVTWSAPQILDQKNTTTPDSAPGVDEFSHVRCDNSGIKCTALRHSEILDNVVLTIVDVYSTVDSGLTWQKSGSLDNSDGNLYERIHAFDCTKDLKTCVAVHSPAGVQNSQSHAYLTHDSGRSWVHRELGFGTPDESPAFLDLFCDNNAILCQIVGM